MSVSLSFIITLYLFPRVAPTVRLCVAAVATVTLLLCIFLLRSHYRIQGIFLCTAVMLAIAVATLTFFIEDGSVRDKIGTEEKLTLTVTEVKSSLPYMTELYVENDDFGALLTCEYALDADIDDTVSGTFHILDFEDNINGYPEKTYQLSKGNSVHLYSYEDDLTVAEGGSSLRSFFTQTRQRLANRFHSVLPEESASYYTCLLLGDKHSLPSFVGRDFRDLGLSHLLAISGMHLGILIGAFIFLLRLFRVPRTPRNIICIIAIMLFAALTGFPPSLTRSAVATSIVLSCYFLRKRPDSATAVTFAVALIYLFDPYSVFDIGLTLSYMATLGIVTVGRLFAKITTQWHIPRPLKGIIDGLFITAIALTFTMPFSLYYFGTYSFVCLFTTLLFSPLVCVALYIAPLVLLLGKTALIGPALCFFAQKLSSFTFDASSFLADILQYTLSVSYPFAKVLFGLFCIGFILLLLLAPRRPLAYLIPILTFTVCIYSAVAIYHRVNEDTVYLSVNETFRNDTLCLTSNGKTTILDITGATSSPASAALYTAESEQYAVYIENYVLFNRTHRTLSFAERLMNANRINNIYLPADILSEDEISDIKDIASERGTKVHLFSFDDVVELDGITVTPETPEYIKRSKMPIHRITITAGEDSVYYTGAAYSELGVKFPQADLVIMGSYGPLYKKDFSYDGRALVSQSAESYYNGNATVYKKTVSVILNND